MPKGSRTVIGYCWPWTVRPGESLDFMVSTHADRSYQADLVRIVCGDGLTKPRMFKEHDLRAPFSGGYQGRAQATNLGSYVEIASHPSLDGLTSFTVQAMVFPTLLPNGVRRRSGGLTLSWEEHQPRDQYLVARWDNQRQSGWALLIDQEGRPVFMVGDGKQVHRTALNKTLVQDRWFLIAGRIDAVNRRLQIAAQLTAGSPADGVTWPECHSDQPCHELQDVPQNGPLRFAACSEGPGNGPRLKASHCFSGRLDRVRLTEGVLDSGDVLALAESSIPEHLRSRVVGFWDFSRDIGSTAIHDLSVNALYGVVVNAPTRSVRGVRWDGSTNDWRQCPDHYSAIHFHDDDLYDAEWQKDFSYTVPEGMPSGIYAARVRQGDSEDYIPFFVAPPRGGARSDVALLIPTATYTAYTNITGFATIKRKRKTVDSSGAASVVDEDRFTALAQNAADSAFLLEHYRTLGKGLYSHHTDGTLSSCASQRHPNMTIKPKGTNWALVADTYITDWLERKQIQYDVITDDLLHREGIELLQQYTVVMTGNHPEYFTNRMLDAVEQFQRQGGRWMYLGGNGFYWMTSFHAELPGLIEVRKDQYAASWQPYEIRHAFDGGGGGLWERNGRPPARVSGLAYSGDPTDEGAPYRRLPESYRSRVGFIFQGVGGEVFGGFGIFGGAAGQEVDAISRERGTPPHALQLARADAFPRWTCTIAEEYRVNSQGPVADIVFYETPNGGAVFSVGSMSWVGALSHNQYENDISRITENVLRRFRDKAPLVCDGETTRQRSDSIASTNTE